MRRLTFAAVLTLLPAAPLAAQDAPAATPARAAEIAAALQRYLPPAEGVVAVVPEGAGYRATLDLGPYAARLPAGTASASVTPLVLTLTERADGLFDVAYDQPFRAQLTAEGALDLDVTLARMSGRGTFDPALAAFTEAEGTYAGLTLVEEIEDGMGRTALRYSVDEITTTTAAAAGPEGLDLRLGFAATGLVEDFTVPGPTPDAPGTPVSVTIARYEGAGEVTGARSAEVMALVAWAVAHPSPDAMLAAQDEARTLIGAALPLFATMETRGTLADIDVVTPIGPVAIDEVGVEIAMNGLVAEGRFSEGFRVSGVTLPPGLVPDWAVPLLPETAELSFDVTGFDLAAPAALLLARPDWTAPLDDAENAALGAALAPQGTVDLALALGAAAAEVFDLDAAGKMTLGPMAPPSGTGRVQLTGIDAILGLLNAAPPEISQGAVPALMMARGMAVAEGDSIVWDIEATPDGKLLVNGSDMTPLMQQ